MDAVVVGAGPNGLTAGIFLAAAGCSVTVLETAPTVGGGCRSAELTLPAFVHDRCAAIHPLAGLSPALRNLPLARHGVELIHPPLPLAHPLDGGRAAVLERSVGATAAAFGDDGPAYRRLMDPLLACADALIDDLLLAPRMPHHPVALARFGARGLRSAEGLARGLFRTEPPRALLAGLAAHSLLPLHRRGTAGFALVLGMCGHAQGWPAVAGGSQRLTDALAAHLVSLGGDLRTGSPVRSLDELPAAHAVLFDVSPRQLLEITGARLPAAYRRRLTRFPQGPGVFKVDAALSEPIPWTAPECRRAGTVHVGGTLEEIAASEAAVAAGRCAPRPFVIVAQQSLFDPSRAPAGRHTAWMYCHVPNGSTRDMTGAIEAQLERFAPGYRDVVLARHLTGPAALERYNANCIGGDIGGGVQDLRHQLTRPVTRLSPYTTPDPRLFICSASTPPGGGVHGMCGHNAARAVLARTRASSGGRPG